MVAHGIALSSRLDRLDASMFGARLAGMRCSSAMLGRVTAAHLRELRDPALTLAIIVGYVNAGGGR